MNGHNAYSTVFLSKFPRLKPNALALGYSLALLNETKRLLLKKLDIQSKLLYTISIYGLSGVNFGNLAIALNQPIYTGSVDVEHQETTKMNV